MNNAAWFPVQIDNENVGVDRLYAGTKLRVHPSPYNVPRCIRLLEDSMSHPTGVEVKYFSDEPLRDAKFETGRVTENVPIAKKKLQTGLNEMTTAIML